MIKIFYCISSIIVNQSNTTTLHSLAPFDDITQKEDRQLTLTMTRYEPAATRVADDDEENGSKYTEITEPLVTADKTQMRTIDSRYALDMLKSPDLQNVAWEDKFFDDDPDVIAVFDYDYEALEKFNSQTGYLAWASTLLYPPIFLATLACAAPCFLKQNVQWNARAQHVAITRDGIRYVRDRRKAGWGLSCTDRGKESKTGK